MLTSSALSRSGTISFASVRSADRQNRFAANYEIRAHECELSRVAMDHAFERSINGGATRSPFVSLLAKTPVMRKTHSNAYFRAPNSLRGTQSPQWRASLAGSSRNDATPKQDRGKTSTEDNLSFEIRPTLSSSAASDASGHVMPELHPSDLEVSDEEESVKEKRKNSDAGSDSSEPTQFNNALQGVEETLKSIGSSLKTNSRSEIDSQEQSVADEDDIAHSVSGEFKPMTLHSSDDDEEEEDIPKPKISQKS